MAIAPMKKVMIVVHRNEVEPIVCALQDAGIIQILDAERAMVSKEWPELQIDFKRPRELEDRVDRLGRAIAFLKPFAGKTPGGLLAPLVPVKNHNYMSVVRTGDTITLLESAEQTQKNIEKQTQDIENLTSEIDNLGCWTGLKTPLQDLFGLQSSACLTGLIPESRLGETGRQLADLGAALEDVGKSGRSIACVVVCLKHTVAEAQKLLRQVDFEPVSFEGYKGTVTEIAADLQSQFAAKSAALEQENKKAAQLAKQLLSLQILHDHYGNLVSQIHTRDAAPASDYVVFFEGWVKTKDHPRLAKLVERFPAAMLTAIEPGQGETIPVEIDNGPASRPFETITRLYGMPSLSDVDPTVFLAPFFALFFGLCMSDAGYGIVMVAALAWVLKKMQGDKKAVWMLMVCSIMTIIAGVLTGSWFADTIPALLPQAEGSIGAKLNHWREKLMLFDPMEKPQYFILLSLVLGYIQMMFGLSVGFFNLLRHKDYVAAFFDKLVWIVYLNCIIAFVVAKSGALPAKTGTLLGYCILILAGLILWFTDRTSGAAGRLGNGGFAVFSTLFWVGDALSYVRLMALCLVGAGLGMAINILTKIMMDIPYVGWLLGLVFFVAGHIFNIVMSMLSSFVHSLRLQFVEFFPKFFTGGGVEFKPLRNSFRHIMIVDDVTEK